MTKQFTLLLLFLTSISISQNSINIINETTNSAGCTNSFNVEYTINNYDSSYTYYIDYTINTDDGPITNVTELTEVDGNGTYIADTKYMNKTTYVNLRSNLFIHVGPLPLVIPLIWDNERVIRCPNDIDSDGVNNGDDNCPGEFGNTSNFGCPGNPDLILNLIQSVQYSDRTSRNGSFDNLPTNHNSSTPAIYRYGGNITMTPIVIENIGTGNPAPEGLKLRFYMSEDMELSSDDFGFGNRTIPFAPPGMGQSTPSSGSGKLQVSLEGSDIGNQLDYGDYYLAIVIDEDNELENSEVSRDNNIYYMPIEYTNYIPSPPIGVISVSRSSQILEDKIFDSKVNVFDFNGIKIKTLEVDYAKNIHSELTSSSLNKGAMYILRYRVGEEIKTKKIILN